MQSEVNLLVATAVQRVAEQNNSVMKLLLYRCISLLLLLYNCVLLMMHHCMLVLLLYHHYYMC